MKKRVFKTKCGRLRRAIFHNRVYFLTTSVESGIMLPANPLVKHIITAALLKAQIHHDINISHLLVNGTHLHFLIRVINPHDVPKFMERFKTESSHYLNRLLGRSKRTIWCERYDMSQELEYTDVIDRIVYLYNNPVKDGLISSIDAYPGLSTWKRFNSPKSYIKGSLLARNDIEEVKQIPNESYFEACRKRLAMKRDVKVLKIDPNDWMVAFGITEPEDIEEVNRGILEDIERNRQEIHEQRDAEGKTAFMGAHKLRNQEIDLSYQPKRSGRKMWCHTRNVKLRKKYIKWIKSLVREAERVYECWCMGDTSQRMPVGMFAPRMPAYANLVFVD